MISTQPEISVLIPEQISWRLGTLDIVVSRSGRFRWQASHHSPTIPCLCRHVQGPKGYPSADIRSLNSLATLRACASQVLWRIDARIENCEIVLHSCGEHSGLRTIVCEITVSIMLFLPGDSCLSANGRAKRHASWIATKNPLAKAGGYLEQRNWLQAVGFACVQAAVLNYSRSTQTEVFTLVKFWATLAIAGSTF
jgi:hypothetical protein